MKTQLLIVMFFFMCLNKLHSQEDNGAYYLSKSDLSSILEKNQGLYLKYNIKDYDNKNNQRISYYIFANTHEIIVDNPNTLEIISYKNDSLFLDSLGKRTKQITTGNFFSHRRIVYDLNNHIDTLLNDFFTSLGLEKKEDILKTNLEELNSKISEYGYGNVIKNLRLNLIIFCGEYIKALYGGEWVPTRPHDHPFEFDPMFYDGEQNNQSDLLLGGVFKLLRYADEGYNEYDEVVSGFDIREIFKIVEASKYWK